VVRTGSRVRIDGQEQLSFGRGAERGGSQPPLCLLYLREQSATRHMVEHLNDRKVPNTANSAPAFDGRQPLHRRQPTQRRWQFRRHFVLTPWTSGLVPSRFPPFTHNAVAALSRTGGSVPKNDSAGSTPPALTSGQAQGCQVDPPAEHAGCS